MHENGHFLDNPQMNYQNYDITCIMNFWNIIIPSKNRFWKCNHTCCDFNIGFVTNIRVTKEDEGWDNVFWFTHIPTKMWECKWGHSQTLPSENHIGSWNPIMLNEFIGQNKPCPNWALIVMVERSWSMNIKSGIIFSIWRFKSYSYGQKIGRESNH